MNTIQTTSATATPGKVTAKNKLSRAGMFVAIGAVLFWAVFAAILLYNAGTKEADKWAHLTFVFASVQGIASAAAGALFGTAVQQDRVKNAETRASVAENAANNGRALALILQNEAAPQLRAPRPLIPRDPASRRQETTSDKGMRPWRAAYLATSSKTPSWVSRLPTQRHKHRGAAFGCAVPSRDSTWPVSDPGPRCRRAHRYQQRSTHG